MPATPLAPLATTSLQRTYRYLRLAIAGCAVVILVAVAIASLQLGTVLPSISAYAYSPARVPVTGALIAAAIGILALSGRGLERALLDAAAVVAPLVALVPTRIEPGAVPGLEVACAGTGGTSCVPASFLPDIETGVLTYLGVGVIGLVTAGIVARLQGTVRGSVPSLIAAAAVVGSVGVLWVAARPLLVEWLHLIAAGAFFALIAAAALRSIRPFDGERPRSHPVQLAFATIGAGIALDVAALIVVGAVSHGPTVAVLVLEVVALALFTVFWLLQSGRTWDAADPAFIKTAPLGS